MGQFSDRAVENLVIITTDDDISLFTYIMRELVWHQPCNKLSHYFSLVIYSLDGNKNLLGTIKCHYRTQVKEVKIYE